MAHCDVQLEVSVISGGMERGGSRMLPATVRYVGQHYRDAGLDRYSVRFDGCEAVEFFGYWKNCDGRQPIVVQVDPEALRELPREERQAARGWLETLGLLVRREGKLTVA